MIEKYFGLKEDPFLMLPNPRFMYLTEQYMDTKSKLLYFLQQRSASLYLYGPIGSGKTTLLKLIASEIENDEKINAKYLIAPSIKTGNELLRLICEKFGIKTDRAKLANLKNIEKFLISQVKEGKYPLIIIDESQNLTLDELKMIHDLLNYQGDKTVLLMIVLVGQPELSQRIANFKSLYSRLMSSSLLEMTREDCEKMIRFRWSIAAGADSTPPFTADAYDEIYKLTMGNPRDTVKLCQMALIKASTKEITSIDKEIIGLSGKEIWPTGRKL
jgi:general secretion pathway protein A